MSFPSVLLGIVAFIATGAVLIVLIMGLVSMLRGGDFNDRNANRLMRMRVIFQGVAALAIGAMMLMFYVSS